MRFFAIQLIDPEKTNIPKIVTDTTKDNNALDKALTLTFVIIGAVSLLMLVVAGFRYVVSAGDKEKMATAKRMIIYTVVGVVVSAMAATFVNVVLGRL